MKCYKKRWENTTETSRNSISKTTSSYNINLKDFIKFYLI